jgi:hypothetical protein
MLPGFNNSFLAYTTDNGLNIVSNGNLSCCMGILCPQIGRVPVAVIPW